MKSGWKLPASKKPTPLPNRVLDALVPEGFAGNQNRFEESGDGTWLIAFDGQSVIVRSTLLGLRDLAQIMNSPGQDVEALSLFGRASESDLGAALDDASIEPLTQAANVKRESGDIEGAEEIEAYLQRGRGIGGRRRRLGSPRKRASDAIRQRLKRALATLKNAAPVAHAHIDDRLRLTPPFRFEPREGDDAWHVIFSRATPNVAERRQT